MTSIFKGIKIHYTIEGKGKPLIFLHGFLENISMWNTIIPSFRKDFQCVSIDLLGHGKTECKGYIHTMEEMAEVCVFVLDELNISEAVFIGHSMGGYVTLGLLDLFEERVAGLVLLNSTSYPDSEERKINRGRAINLVKKNPKAYTGMAIANLFADNNRDKFENEIAQIKSEASKTSLQGIIAAQEGMKIRKDYSSLLKKLKKPKLIIAGKKDPVLVYDQSCDESRITRTKLIALNGGHMSHIENQIELITKLREFLL